MPTCVKGVCCFHAPNTVVVQSWSNWETSQISALQKFPRTPPMPNRFAILLISSIEGFIKFHFSVFWDWGTWEWGVGIWNSGVTASTSERSHVVHLPLKVIRATVISTQVFRSISTRSYERKRHLVLRCPPLLSLLQPRISECQQVHPRRDARSVELPSPSCRK